MRPILHLSRPMSYRIPPYAIAQLHYINRLARTTRYRARRG